MRRFRSDNDKDTHSTASRRDFLHHAGIAGAATAAIIGGADLVGLTSASAATKAAKPKYRRFGPDVCTCEWECVYHRGEPGCHGTCPSGSCCYLCTASPASCGSFSGCYSGYKDCASHSICGH